MMRGVPGAALTAIGFTFAMSSSGAAELPRELASEMDFYRPIPIFSSATRLRSAVLDTPASVTIIDRELIEASTATTIPDLLRLVPGFQVAHATGAQYTATYHGVSDQLARRLEVMVNGQSVYLPTYSAVEWNLLGVALEDIERIEVVRSPNAPAYGSNAIFGSINIITRQPFDLAGKYLRLTGGSLDTGIGVARGGGKVAGMDAVATLQYVEDDGFDRIDDHKRMRNLRVQATRDFGLNDVLDIELGLSTGEVGGDGDGTGLDPFRDRRLRDNYQKIEWRNGGVGDEGYRAAFSHRYTSQDDSFSYYVSPDVYLPLGYYDVPAEHYDLELEQRLAPHEDWRVLWGAGARYAVAESDLYLTRTHGKVSEWNGRLFANAEWRPRENLLFNFGALTEFHEIADTCTSPRLAVNWRFSENQALRASASRNYRVFSATDQLADYPLVLSDGTYLGQLVRSMGPGLEPEKLTSYELGYVGDWPSRSLSFDAKVFREEMRDIELGARDPDGVTIWGGEGGRWTTEGIEAQLRFKPDRDTLFVGSYSYADTEGERVIYVDANGVPVRWGSLDRMTPRHTLALQLNRKFAHDWSGTLALFHVGGMHWLGEGRYVDAYTRLDLKVAKGFRLGGADAEVALIVQNLTDDPYYEFRPNAEDVDAKPGNLFERRAFLQLRLQLP